MKVRAKQRGYYGERIIEEGQVFECTTGFSKEWMEALEKPAVAAGDIDMEAVAPRVRRKPAAVPTVEVVEDAPVSDGVDFE